MYSNNTEQIKSGLVNYIGAIINSYKTENVAATKQLVVAILLEEALKISQEEDSMCNLYALKPLFRANIFIAKQQIAKLQNAKEDNELVKRKLQEQINYHNNIIVYYTNLINLLEGE